jgi:hypothetical protein
VSEAIAWDFVPTDETELATCLADPWWRLCSGQLYQIMVKSNEGEDSSVVPFRPNAAQLQVMRNLWHRNIILKARQLGFCLDPSTRVLTANLRWVRIDSLKPGDEVVAVDEHALGGRGQARRMRTATVQAAVTVHRPAYLVTFDDGRTVTCTGQHPWLSRKAGTECEWRAIEPREGLKGRLKVGTLVKWITKPWGASTVEDGWMGGMLDGEGSIAKASHAAGINVSQREGPVWDRVLRYAREREYNACIEGDRAERPSKHGRVPVPKLSFGRMDEMFRLIGQTRPTRFIGNRFWEGRELPGKRNGDTGWARITRIDLIGTQDMVDLQTSTGTYIAEGFVSHNTTLVAILWLDHALFNADQRCGMIAQDRENAETFFRDKVKLAYDRLPPEIRESMPLARETTSELLFAHNNSSIRVATSVRSGTIHRLHVSEFGKICAKFPEKAVEVVTGSLPAVPLDGIAIIESTAEGQDGDFYKMTQRAMALEDAGKELTPRDYRFHFFPWWADPQYRIEQPVPITGKDAEYFNRIEAEMGCTLDAQQRHWYVATRDSDFSGDEEKMWQEYPSTPIEAFQVSSEGKYYAKQLAQARKDRRITVVPHQDGVPVNTFWDIGGSDGTAIWLHQRIGLQNRFIGFIQGWGEPYSYYAKELQQRGYLWGKHHLPHDATHKRQQAEVLSSPEDELKKLPIAGEWVIVPRVDDVNHGIQLTRNAFSTCWFDEVNCKEGLEHLASYSKTWNDRAGCWSTQPRHDIHSEAADAFRQFGQGYDAGESAHRPSRRERNWRTA